MVSNFQFSPANFTATVGDTVRWIWVNGSHTTTSGTIPGGAAAWDNPMNSGVTQFDYKITAAGIYNYICSFHSAFGMVASFTANPPVFAVHTVNMSNFQFNPNNFTAVVGDTVRWVWLNGNHTTTSGTIPGGAPTWNNPINSGSTQFDYVITTAGAYGYFCTPHQGLGMVANFTANSVAPVKLTNFMVKPDGPGKAVLRWQTAQEENAGYFAIQRSVDGKTFDEIGKVKAVGNSNQLLNYSFSDDKVDPHARYMYYRLLSVDLDGKSETSPIKMIRQDIREKKIIVSLSPNPVKAGDHIEIWFNSDVQTSLNAQVYDITGKLVFHDKMSAFPGVNFGHLHIHSLQKGSYMVKVTIGKLRETVQVLVE